MTKRARVAGIAIALVGATINSCTDALTPTTDAVVTLSEAGTWPRALAVAEIATITASVANGTGSSVLGVDLDWSTSDSSVITIAKIATTGADAPISSPGLNAVITTHAPGTATIFARLTRAGFAPAELSIPVVVEQRGWDTLVTVSRIDTAAINLGSANSAILEDATVTWQSSDVSVLRVDKLTTDPFRAQFTPRSSGAVTITATVTGPAIGRSVLQLPVSVGVIQVTQDATVPWDTLMTVSDTATLTLRIADAAGIPLAGVPVQWRSTNQVAVAVVNGRTTALREGGAEIIATVGNPAFETSELRGVITVRNVLVTEATNWPDTLSVTDTTNLTVAVKDAKGATRAGVNVRWTSTNPLAFKVESTGIASARVIALSSGGGEIVATVGEGDFQTSEHRAAILVLPLGVVPTTRWPDSITVADSIQLAVTVAGGGGDARATRVRWSSTTAAFIVSATGDATARIIALSQGSGEIVATVGEPPFQVTERRATIKVVPLHLQQASPWPVSINLGGDTTLRATVIDAFGNPRLGRRVRWRSTNEAAFSVDTGGRITPLKPGAGEVIATVGEAPFQTTDLRGPLRVQTRWRSVSTGWAHTCAITADERAGYCWGNNRFAQLGAGESPVNLFPRPGRIATLFKFDDLLAGGTFGPEAHACGRSGNTMLCWGAAFSGQIGDGSGPCLLNTSFTGACTRQLPFAAIDNGILPGSQVAVLKSFVGGRVSCAAAINELVETYLTCWGMVASDSTWRLARTGSAGIPGSTGKGTRPQPAGEWAFPSDIGLAANGSGGAVAGGGFICMATAGILPAAPAIACRGENNFGQLGDTVIVIPGDSVKVVRDAFGLVVQFPRIRGTATAGARHACILESSGTSALCWGGNEQFQLGSTIADACAGGPCGKRARSVTLPGGVTTAISAGGAHTCTLVAASGNVFCWGSNEFGQLGRNSTVASDAMPRVVTGNLRFTAIAAGYDHTCGLTFDGALYCWGRNDQGQLGDGTLIDRSSPVRVIEPPN